ncbi:hypothetical protein ABTF76_21330, partial [Acinetobacter baumannii]
MVGARIQGGDNKDGAAGDRAGNGLWFWGWHRLACIEGGKVLQPNRTCSPLADATPRESTSWQ